MAQASRDHSEVELKFELSGRAAKQVRRHALLPNAGQRTQSQESVYFDTDDGAVH